MKIVLVLGLSLISLSSFASTYDGDLTDIYKSWCDQDNVIQYDYNGQEVVVQSCASNQQVCQLDQKTSGKRVIYTATCQDKQKPYARE